MPRHFACHGFEKNFVHAFTGIHATCELLCQRNAVIIRRWWNLAKRFSALSAYQTDAEVRVYVNVHVRMFFAIDFLPRRAT